MQWTSNPTNEKRMEWEYIMVYKTKHAEKITNYPYLVMYLIVLISLIGFGIYSSVSLISKYGETLMKTIQTSLEKYPFLYDLMSDIILFTSISGLIFITLSIIAIFIWLYFLRAFGEEFIQIVYYLIAVTLILVGVLLAIMIVPLLLAVLGGFMIWKAPREKLRRIGKFLELGARVTLEEKAMLGLTLLFLILTYIFGIILFFTDLYVLDQFGSLVIDQSGNLTFQLEQRGTILLLIVDYLYLIVYFGLYYILGSALISYSYRWYRGEDPDLKSAFTDIKAVIGPILLFSFVRATLEFLVKLGRMARQMLERKTSDTQSSKDLKEEVGAIILLVLLAGIGYIISFTLSIFLFFTFFTLPYIVIKRRRFIPAIKESAKLVWKNLFDVFIAEFGVGIGFGIITVVNFLIFLGFALVTGMVLFSNNIVGFIIYLFFGIMFGYIPLQILFTPVKYTITTFLFAYILDREEGFKKPSRLPAEYKRTLDRTLKSVEASSGKVKRKMPRPYWT